ncbi:MAG: CocE/NonD family hydrolase [Ignavibacteriae bacterium]|nr:MAG: CocE/NonD family hydrolase [Ignavibacteriota bacterium]
MKYIPLLFVLIHFTVFASGPLNEDSLYLAANYTKAEYQIPMRDGVKLYTIVYTPKDTATVYPILFFRTPYSIAPYGPVVDFSTGKGIPAAFLREGYILAYQDVRGRFMSEGTFQHMTPFIENKKTKNDIDESSDTYDTIDWLVKNLRHHNRRVGMLGISYPGFYTSYAAINAHPALKCVSPQAPIGDWFFDDIHHRGAFFMAANFEFLGVMDQPRHGLIKDWVHPYDWKTTDGYNFFQRLEPLQNAKTRYFGDSIAFWNEVIAHPNYDEFWQARNILPHLKNIKPAVLLIGGWYDAEDLYGTFKTYRSIEQNNPGIHNSMVIGPWIHGGWARTDGSFLGNVSFGRGTSQFCMDSIEIPFFNFYLKDKGLLNLPEATMFMTGRNEWKTFGIWPPNNVESKKLYFHAKGQLSFDRPQPGEPPFDEYISDPSKPVPYTEDIAFGMTKEYMTDDQRFASRRPDVMVYETDILDEEMVFAGPSQAHLKVSTSESDADWVVKLIDVYPGDAPDNPTTRSGKKMSEYQQMVRSEVIRGRFRMSYEQPVPFIPGKVDEVNLELQDVLHCFKKGHRIMVQVQNTWFPLVDLNPQKYVKNIYETQADDFVKATHRIYHQPSQASFIEIGILK